MARARSGRRTDYTWQGVTFGATLAAAGNVTQVITTPQASSTVMRLRGELVASIDGPVDNDKVAINCGIIVVTEEQVAGGASTMPSPAGDLDAEWIWHGFLLLLSQAVVATAQLTQAARLTIDSKAMRRIKQTQSVILIVENTSLAGTPATDVMGGVRALFGA